MQVHLDTEELHAHEEGDDAVHDVSAALLRSEVLQPSRKLMSHLVEPTDGKIGSYITQTTVTLLFTRPRYHLHPESKKSLSAFRKYIMRSCYTSKRVVPTGMKLVFGTPVVQLRNLVDKSPEDISNLFR